MPLVALSGVTVGLEGQIYTAHVSKQVRRRLMHGQEEVGQTEPRTCAFEIAK